MNKRGQVTIFVIIGIVLIILILLIIFLRNKVYIGTASTENLEAQFPQIQQHIEECLIEVAEPRIRQMGLQGGFIDVVEATFRDYNNFPVHYLCFNIQDQPNCRSRFLTLQQMEEELSQFIKDDLERECLNVQAFDKLGFTLNEGSLEIDASIGQDAVVIEATKPITLSKGEARAEESVFTSTVNLPLGRLYEASRDIVDAEALLGNFDTLLYSVIKTQLTGKPYIIQKLQPYPDKIYIMKIKDIPSKEDPFIFQFWIEDEPR